MVLASQTPRQTNAWRYTTNERRRRKSKGRLLLWVGTLAVVGVAAWAIFLRSPASEQGSSDDASSGQTSGTSGAEGGASPVSSPAADAIRGAGGDSRRQGSTADAGERAAAPPVISLGGDRRGSSPAPGTGSSSERSAGEAAVNSGVDAAQRGPERTSPAPREATSTQPNPSGAPGRTAGDERGSGGGARGPQADGPGAGSRGVTPEPLSAAIALAERDPVAARRQLSAIVEDGRFSPAERAKARETIAAINRRILFSPVMLPNDPMVRSYTVQSGDSLQKIARSQGMGADWRLLQRINGIADERRLKVGQVLKIVPGTFHAVVDKANYRMDVFLEQGGQRTFVVSLPVGLGELNSTPAGRFKVRPGSRLVNPAWTNPRTGEHFKADDPKNPIGEFWIGLQGIDRDTETVEKIGIHGTIDPASIGRQMSMGCVRLAAPDIALVYELLTDPGSVVEIRE